MMRRLLLLTPLLLAACITPPAQRSGTGQLVLRTVPEGATVSFSDGTECRTPCRIVVPGPLSLTIGRTGYEAVRERVDARTPSPLVIEMTPVARTEEIEAAELPEL